VKETVEDQVFISKIHTKIAGGSSTGQVVTVAEYDRKSFFPKKGEGVRPQRSQATGVAACRVLGPDRYVAEREGRPSTTVQGIWGFRRHGAENKKKPNHRGKKGVQPAPPVLMRRHRRAEGIGVDPGRALIPDNTTGRQDFGII